MTANFTGLKTNNLDSPLGVGEKPCYSFALESDGRNVLLDSYTLTLCDPEQRIVFENKVTRDRNDPIITSGMIDAPLEPFTRYTWTLEGICSSDGSTFAVTPASAYFETGYIGEPLENAEWITLGKTHYFGRCSDFRLEVGFVPNENQFSHIYSKNATVGIIFAAADEGNYYLLKLFTDIDEKKLTAAICECSDGVTSQLFETDVSDILVPADFIGSEHSVVIAAGEPLTVLLDGHTIFSEKLDIRAGGFGISQPYPANARFTHVKFDSSDEHISEDFSNPNNLIFTGGIFGNGYTVIQKNALFPLDFAPAPVFRRDFTIKQGLVSARFNASAAGIYELFLNGEKVGDTFFDPGRTRVQNRVMYQTFDLTGLLKVGENTLSVAVGHGWYNRAMNYAGTTLAFIGEIILKYENGEESIVTGSDWLSNADGSVRYDDIFNGEIIDSRKALNSESKGWTNARTTTADALSVGRIVPQNGPRVKCFEKLEPVAVTEPLPGVRVYDFGKNIAGICRLTLSGERGSKVVMRHAEILNAENLSPSTGAPGTINTANLRTAANRDVYILSGDGTETFEPSLVYHGFRYMELTTEGNVGIERVEALVLCSELELTGDFECSDRLVNQFVKNTRQSMIDNFLSVPTDCPQRDERLGWAGDAQIFAPTAAYLADVFGFMDKYLADTRDTQSADGNFDDRAPNFRGRVSPVGGWSDAGVLIPYLLYRRSGDDYYIRSNYDAMKRYAELIIRIFSKNGYIDVDIPNTFGQNTYGDWLGVETTPCVITETAFGEHSLRLLSEMAGVIGNDSDSAYLAAEADKVREAWNREFVCPDGGTKCDPKVYGTGYWGNRVHPDTGEVNTQCSWVVGLAFGLFDEKTAPLAAKRLAESVISGGYSIKVGFLGVGLILPVLSENGFADAAFKMLCNDTCPSWLYQVKTGATSIYEFWDGVSEKDGKLIQKGSLNHYSYGAAVEWLFSDVLGIREGIPGYGEIILKPTVNGLMRFAHGSYRSPRGLICSEWSSEDGLVLRVRIPANTRAKLWLPKEGEWLEVGTGKKANAAEPLGLGSGSYEFRYIR